MAIYYYIGGATGAMRTASDWSTTSGGSALSSITWCSGDTMVVDSDAVITSDLVVASTTNATSGLLVTGSGSPVIVYTYNADGSPTLGTAESPFILPDCLVSIKLSSGTKSTWTLHLKCNTNTKIKELYLDCALHFYADSLDTIPVMGNIYTHSSIGSRALEFHNVSAFRLMGEGDQFIYSFNSAPGWGLDADTPVLLDKTLGSVTLIQYSDALGVANTAHDPMVVSGACPTIIVDDIAAANAALGTSWTAMSYGPIRLNGNLTCESLTLANGVDATYPTRIEIPSGKTLQTTATTWGQNCEITGMDTDSDGTRDSFGVYKTTCTNGAPSDLVQTNYNVSTGITTLCLTGNLPAPFSLRETVSGDLSGLSVIPGSFVFCRDSGVLYYDTSEQTRIAVS